MLNVLVVGGAGYIGSHMVKRLGQLGCHTVTLDDLSSGHRDAVMSGEFVQGDMSDRQLLEAILSGRKIDVVMHFASYIRVDESSQSPAKYYRNNVSGSLALLDAMKRTGVDKFVFSSSAAVYGAPQSSPIGEDHPTIPMSPYGRSKLMVEQILQDYDLAYGLKSFSLRYFNAAGADPEGELGERHDPETHLIPLVLQAASGRKPYVQVFGRDYDTLDGTCVRDFVHVWDLCEAHWLAVQALAGGSKSLVMNLGNGDGFSVQEVIEVAKRVTGRKIETVDAPRRPCDPSHLVASNKRAYDELGWRAKYGELSTIVAHAWNWEQRFGN